MERLGYVKQLVFSKTKLEFRLLWNKVFQKEDDELGWLLNPYKQSRTRGNATMMTSFGKNMEDSYQFGYDDVSSSFGREKVTVYNRGLARKGDTRKRKAEEKSFTDSAIEVARYMGMGAYLTASYFPSPFYPVNDTHIYDESVVNESMLSNHRHLHGAGVW